MTAKKGASTSNHKTRKTSPIHESNTRFHTRHNRHWPAQCKRIQCCVCSANKQRKVKQSHFRPRQALRVPGGWCYKSSWQSTHEGGKIVSPTHRPPLPPRKYSWYSFLLEAESIKKLAEVKYLRTDFSLLTTSRPEGLYQWKIPVTTSGIEPATFQLVAQCLNQPRHHVPLHLTIQAACSSETSAAQPKVIRL
jgi:hypothetical protein